MKDFQPNQTNCALFADASQPFPNIVPRTARKSSICIFRRFIVTKSKGDGNVEHDVSQIISRKCYEAWLASRGVISRAPEKIFQRTLTAHITASDTRQPFHPKEEAAILVMIRSKGVWLVCLFFFFLAFISDARKLKTIQAGV